MAINIGRDVREYSIWAKEFNIEDEGVDAFIALQKLRMIENALVAKGEGWEDVLDEIVMG